MKHWLSVTGAGEIFIWFNCSRCHREFNIPRDFLWRLFLGEDVSDHPFWKEPIEKDCELS